MTPEPIERSGPPAVAVLFLILGAMFAGGAYVLGDVAVKAKGEAVRRGWTFSRVLVTARDLPAGAALKREDLEPRDIPEQLVTGSLFTDARELEGKVLYAPITRGTPVHPAWFATRHCEAAK